MKLNTEIRNVVQLLRDGDETDAITILQRIRGEDSIDNAIGTIAGAHNLLSAVDSVDQIPRRASEGARLDIAWPSRSSRSSLTSSPSNTPPIDPGSSSSRSEHRKPNEAFHFQGQYIPVQHAYVEKDMHVDHSVLITPWTNVSDDNNLMHHLLSLFWTWDNHVERVLYRPLFEEDLSRDYKDYWSTPTHAFCSPFLVNALLAVGSVRSPPPLVVSL